MLSIEYKYITYLSILYLYRLGVKLIKTYSVTDKKLIRWATGIGVFVTTETKKFGWNDKTKVIISAIEDKEGKAIIIRKSG